MPRGGRDVGRFAFLVPEALASDAAAPLLCGRRDRVRGPAALGAALEPIPVPPHVLLAQRIVTGSAIGSRSSVRETPESAARHGVAAKVEARVLADAALDHVRRGRARHRVVVAP